MSDDRDRDLDDALARWQPPGPPTDFATRVDVGAMAAGSPAAGPRRPRWPFVVATVSAVAVAAAIAVVAWPSADVPSNVIVASRPFEARESVNLGGRGVAVAEPGAAFGWRRDGAALTVRQESGDVFYRVDHVGDAARAPFVVTTPAGEIRVTGTCFRVEVVPMKPSKASVLGAAAGAVIATAAVVTVYEGKVLVASPAGKAEVKAGERATLDGTPPLPSTVAGPPIAIAVPSEPSANITRDELLVRDKTQREQIAALSTRLKDLESAMAAGGGMVKRKGPGGPGDDTGYVDPTKEDLLALSKVCGVKIDLPAMVRGESQSIDPKTAEAVGLSAEEVAQSNQVFEELKQSWLARVRGWYVEATGDRAGSDQLSVHAMAEEIRDKAAAGEPEALQKRISYERAGLLAKPTDLSRTSPFERYYRAFVDFGVETERTLATKIGAEKAHAVRSENGGWGMRMAVNGCSDEENADENQ